MEGLKYVLETSVSIRVQLFVVYEDPFSSLAVSVLRDAKEYTLVCV